jgi:hypothetical protein
MRNISQNLLPGLFTLYMLWILVPFFDANLLKEEQLFRPLRSDVITSIISEDISSNYDSASPKKMFDG